MDSRDQQISIIETRVNARLICYCTGDRPGMEAQIGMDVVPRFRRHLESIGETQCLGLFLYSRGGDTNVPWRLVNLVREYCKELIVLVPFRAHSAATLLSLGANRIFMGKMGELSSIDPSVANQFNPPDPVNPSARIPISVEDVNAYKDLARRFGVKPEDPALSAQVFMGLVSKVDPLALGNVERNYNQIRKLAEDHLRLHLAGGPDAKERVKGIVETLTERLYSHGHLINRREAEKIGLNVESCDSSLDKMLWELFQEYAEEMELDRPFNAPQLLGTRPSLRIELKRAVIESRSLTDAFVSEGTIARHTAGAIQLPQGLQLPPGVQAQLQVAFQIESEGWKILR
jgi:hypothetical protein